MRQPKIYTRDFLSIALNGIICWSKIGFQRSNKKEQNTHTAATQNKKRSTIHYNHIWLLELVGEKGKKTVVKFNIKKISHYDYWNGCNIHASPYLPIWMKSYKIEAEKTRHKPETHFDVCAWCCVCGIEPNRQWNASKISSFMLDDRAIANGKKTKS